MAFPTNTTVLDAFNRADGGLGASWTALYGTLAITQQSGYRAVGQCWRIDVQHNLRRERGMLR